MAKIRLTYSALLITNALTYLACLLTMLSIFTLLNYHSVFQVSHRTKKGSRVDGGYEKGEADSFVKKGILVNNKDWDDKGQLNKK